MCDGAECEITLGKKREQEKGEEGNAAGEQRGGESQVVSQRRTDVAEEGFFVLLLL